MPGVHFVYDRSGEGGKRPPEDTLRSLLHFDDYRSDIVRRDSCASLAVTRYAEYPITTIDLGNFFVLMEGRIYGLDGDQLNRHLSDLTPLLFQNSSESHASVREWLLAHDGDYIVVAHHKDSGDWAFLNDPLARLPLYVSSSVGRLVVSRELAFVTDQIVDVEMDRMALAQQMLFEAPLGLRTPIQGVDRLPPATLVQLDGKQGTVRRTMIDAFTLDTMDDGGSLEQTAGQLVATFANVCGQMQARGSSVVSLSGGLDSRSVAAGLVLAGGRPTTVTFMDAEHRARADVELAEKAAYALGLPWELVTLPPPTGYDADRLLRLKGGMNYTAMAMSMPYLSHIREQRGAGIAYFTGDGGDKLLPDISGPPGLGGIDQLVHYTVARNQLMPLSKVARLFGLARDDILAGVSEVIGTYPEASASAKYRGFLVRERGIKWLFEGEDRNRAFFWSCSPFYAYSFFEKVVAIPAEMKRYNRLYRAFLMRLSPAVAGIPDAKRGLPVTSPSYERKLRLIAMANRYPRALRNLKSILQRPTTYHPEAGALRILTQQAESSKAVKQHVDINELKKLIADSSSLPRELFDNLLTITTMIERYRTGTDSLQYFLEERMS